MSARRLLLLDTTLRDGEQRAGLAFSREEKVAAALRLDRYGIDLIEAGTPAMWEEEKEAIREIIRRRQTAKIITWNRMNARDIRASLDIAPDIIHIGVPVSDIQIAEKLRLTREALLEKMKRCVDLAQQGSGEITLGLEDASRADAGFLRRVAELARRLGVTRLRYADTVGIAHPSKVAGDMAGLCRCGLPVECHAHNDLGMAVANSLEAAKSGAECVDTTFFGIGERAGNCDFSRFLAAAVGRFSFGFPTDAARVAALAAEMRAILRLHSAVRA